METGNLSEDISLLQSRFYEQERRHTLPGTNPGVQAFICTASGISMETLLHQCRQQTSHQSWNFSPSIIKVIKDWGGKRVETP